MKGKEKIKAWLELEQERVGNGICRDCFSKSLKIVLSHNVFKELKKQKNAKKRI